MESCRRTVGTSAKNWGTVFAIGSPGLSSITTRCSSGSSSASSPGARPDVGKVVPAGIGAVIGGVGNRAMGKTTIKNARQAFGPAPVVWPTDGTSSSTPSRSPRSTRRSRKSPTKPS